MKSTLYWTAIFLGVFVIYVFYKWNKQHMEMFQGDAAAAPAPAPTTEKANDYNEMTSTVTDFVNNFPKYSTTDNKLFVYLSSFSKMTSRKDPKAPDNMLPVYSSKDLVWRNMINENDFYLVKDNAATAPDTLETSSSQGLAMNGFGLKGPSSEIFSVSESNYELPTFTIAFYMKFNKLDFKDITEYTLFEMYAESPNHVSWKLKKKDSLSATMEVVIGNEGLSYTWVVPISTIVSNGNFTLYTMTLNREAKEVRVFIGTTGQYRKALTSDPVIKLANTSVMISSEQKLDVVLRAFTFYKGVALDQSDLVRLNDYFVRESGGLNKVLSEATQKIQEAEEQRKYIEQQLSESQENIDDLNEKLKQCQSKQGECATTKKEFEKVKSYGKWHINMDFDSAEVLPTDNLKKCSALKVKDFGDAKETSPLEKQIPPELASQYAPKKPFSDYDIEYPTKLLAKQKEVKAEPTVPSTTTPASTSTSTTTPATTSTNTTTTPPPSTNDAAFWTGLLNYVSEQQKKNEAMNTSSSTSTTDLNKTYNDLRATVTTDKTQPGPGATLTQPVQDPPKPTETAPAPTSAPSQKPFWQFFKDMFF
jgi:hypothetical protein